ncbi:MAG: tripartite tricarboxylate transporter permease [Candidatus Aenigmatarchaeota archaeon]
MIVEILISVLFGVILGLITGLIPGVHPNTVFVMVITFFFFLGNLPFYPLFAFIISLAISNTFFDFIPSILFGAPEEDTSLSVLPGHKLLLNGHGYEAIFLVTIGGLGVMLLTLLTLPFIFLFIPFVYTTTRSFIHFILILVVIWMFLNEKKKLIAILIFTFSGIFGFLTLHSFPSNSVLFSALTGLFGLSSLYVSINQKTKIPSQKINKNININWFKGTLIGWLAGIFSSLLPGVGSSQAGVLASQMLKAKIKDFLIALGGINTANIFFTFLVFYFTGKTRSGAVWAISQITEYITLNDVLLLVIIGIFVSLISAVLTIKIGKYFLIKMKNIDYTKFTKTMFILLISLIFLFCGLEGLLIAFTGMFIGIFTITSHIRRTWLMSFLLLPTILYFSGLVTITTLFFW